MYFSMRKYKQGVSSTLKKSICSDGYFYVVITFLSVLLTPCLHLRVEKYITIKDKNQELFLARF
jgi:hypothetical protein